MADYSEHAALSPVITRSGKAGAWSIQREWICEDGMAQTLIDSLWGTTAEGFTGFNPPKCDYVRSRPEGNLKGMSRVTAIYRTQSLTRFREKNIARVTILPSGRPIKMQKDINGQIVEGWNEARTVAYQVTRGSNSIYLPQCNVRVETASDTLNLGNILGKIGKVNSNPMSNLGAAAGTMLLLGAPATRYWQENALWYLNYTFAYDPDGHNSRLGVTPTVPVAMQIEEVDDTGTPTGEYRSKLDYLPTGAEESRTSFGGSDFSSLDGQISWT